MRLVRVLSALMVGALVLGAPAAVVQGAATTFTVNSTGDAGDVNQGDGVCETAPSNANCTLRAAIEEANANAGTDTIEFAIPAATDPGCNAGTGVCTVQPTSALPFVTESVIIDAYTQPGASPNTNTVTSGLGLNTVLKIELDGTNAGASTIGLLITGASTVRGLAINRFTGGGEAIRSAAANVIEGNFLGTDVTGTVALGNGWGIVVENASGTTMGGTASGAPNLISGNNIDGILILGVSATANLIEGNFIGTDISGAAALGNSAAGVKIDDGASNNTVGGTTAGARNVISANGSYGVFIVGPATGNSVQGNFIGTDVTGAAVLGNSSTGVLIDGASNNTIGGTTSGTRNVISANGGGGVVIGGPSSGNTVQGNFIGTDATGILDRGNSNQGVRIVISASASNNTVGGTTAGAGNTISFNSGDGVAADSGTGIAILGNSVFSNTGLGIDLSPDGVTPNDAGDGDAGANNLQNFPILTSAVTGGGTITIGGTLNSAASTDFRVEFFANSACDPSGFGEGETFLGAATATTDSGGTAVFSVGLTKSVSVGAALTATATDPDNNTSEFSACLTAAAPPTPVPGITWQGLAGLAALLAGAFAWTRAQQAAHYGRVAARTAAMRSLRPPRNRLARARANAR